MQIQISKITISIILGHLGVAIKGLVRLRFIFCHHLLILCCSKPLLRSFFSGTQNEMFSKMSRVILHTLKVEEVHTSCALYKNYTFLSSSQTFFFSIELEIVQPANYRSFFFPLLARFLSRNHFGNSVLDFNLFCFGGELFSCILDPLMLLPGCYWTKESPISWT